MALIQCPECQNMVSDQAEVCPKCGYALKAKEEPPKKEPPKFKGKIDYKYIILGLLIVVVGFFILNQTRSTGTPSGTTTTTAPQTPSAPSGTVTQPSSTGDPSAGNVVYNDTNVHLQYQIPAGYKTCTDQNGLSYVGRYMDSNGALIPYVMLGWSADYTDPVQFLNAMTAELQKTYGDVTITVDMLSAYIGSHYTYGIQYRYTSGGHVVIDNRYATVVDGKLLMVGSKEENINTDEINNVVSLIIMTMQKGS